MKISTIKIDERDKQKIHIQSFNGKMLKEKNSRIGGIKITISKAIKEIVHAKNKYGFRGEFLLNKEILLEC